MSEVYCGKKSYSKKEAQENKNYIKRERGTELRIYQCPQCNFWHLTHKLDDPPFKKPYGSKILRSQFRTD